MLTRLLVHEYPITYPKVLKIINLFPSCTSEMGVSVLKCMKQKCRNCFGEAIQYMQCQRHGLVVPRAGDRSYVTGSIHDWSRPHLTYVTGGC